MIWSCFKVLVAPAAASAVQKVDAGKQAIVGVHAPQSLTHFLLPTGPMEKSVLSS
jgi:hypothetical protein